SPLALPFYCRHLRAACTVRQSCCTFLFFQAEDGIRDLYVTGVQTCALPIYCQGGQQRGGRIGLGEELGCEERREHRVDVPVVPQIGRASCRERVQTSGGGCPIEKRI